MKKILTFLSAMIVCVSLCDKKDESISLVNRTIDTNQMEKISFDEYNKKIRNCFNSISYEKINDEEFEVNCSANITNLNGLDFAATNSEEITKDYLCKVNYEEEKFYIIEKDILNGLTISEEEYECIPLYDSVRDDYFIEFEDGRQISLREIIDADNVEQCVCMALTFSACAAVAVVAVVAIVELAPMISEIVETIYTWVCDLFAWIKSIFVKTIFAYAVSVNSISYSLEKAGTFDINKYSYYLAIADTVDGNLYLSTASVNRTVAAGVLTTATYLNCITNKEYASKKFVLSIYTFTDINAQNLAEDVGAYILNPGCTFHKANKVGYFDHYHPGKVYTSESKPHVFFGNPLGAEEICK